MKEPHRKGVANHPDPESCAGGGNIAGEALTGAHAGQPLSSEITSIGVPTPWLKGEGHTKRSVQRELPMNLLLDVGYVGTQTRHGLARYPFNEAPFGSAWLSKPR